MAQVGNYLNSNALSLILNEVCPTNLICLTKDAGNPAMFIIHQIGCTCRWGGDKESFRCAMSSDWPKAAPGTAETTDSRGLGFCRC